MPPISNAPTKHRSDKPASTGRAIFFLGLASFASAAATRIADALLPLFAQEFSRSVGAAAMAATAYSLAYGLFQPFFGRLGDVYGKYRLALASAVLSCLATFVCAATWSLESLSLARFFAGASAAGVIPLAIAWIGDMTAPAQRQMAIARYMSANVLGLIAGIAISGWIAERFSWRAAFLAIGALYVFSIIGLAYQLAVNPATRRAQGSPAPGFFATLRGVASSPYGRATLISVFLEGAFCFGALAFVTAMARDRFGLGFGAAGLVLAAFGAGGVAYTLGAGVLARRLGERGVALAGGALLALSFALLAAAASPLMAALGAAGVGAGFYGLHNVLQTNAAQIAPLARATGVGLFATALFLGQGAGAWVGAHIYDAYGATPIFCLSMLGLPLIALYILRNVAGRGPEADA